MVLRITYLFLRIPKTCLPRVEISSFVTVSSVLCRERCILNTSTSFYNELSAARSHSTEPSIPVSITNFDAPLLVLQEIYDLSIADLNSVLQNTPKLALCDVKEIRKNACYLKEEGVNKRTILLVPWILGYGEGELSYALSCIKKCHENVNVSAPLLKLPLNKLRRLSFVATQDASKLKEGNRISMIAKALECDPLPVAQSLAKYTFMLTMSLERLSENLRLLTDFEVPADNILRDGWVFQYRPETVESRLSRAKEAGLWSLRTWFVRCPEDTFNRMIAKRTESAAILRKHTSVHGYLQHRLLCSDEVMFFIHLRTPQLLRASISKLRYMLDFLFSNGYTPEQVCQVPRVLARSVKTVAARQRELLELGYQPQPVPLIVLCKSQREFEELLSKVKNQREE